MSLVVYILSFKKKSAIPFVLFAVGMLCYCHVGRIFQLLEFFMPPQRSGRRHVFGSFVRPVLFLSISQELRGGFTSDLV